MQLGYTPTTNSTNWLVNSSTGVKLARIVANAFPKPYGIKRWTCSGSCPPTRVAQHLRLSPNDLKKHMAMQFDPHATACRTTPGFVEVPLATATPQLVPPTEIEGQRQDGAWLRLHVSETSLAAIVRRFLEA